MNSSLSRITLTSRNLSHRIDSMKSLTIRREHSLILSHLEDQIEVCTDKYENQKRRYLMIEQTYEQIEKEHKEMIVKLTKLKKKQGSSEAIQLRTKTQSLELSLQQVIERHDDLLSVNSKLKQQVNQRRMDRKNLRQKQQGLSSLLKSLSTELSILFDSNSTVSENVNNQRFILRNIMYQNDQEKDHQAQKLQGEYLSNPPKPKSLHVKEEVEVMDCLTLVKFRLRRLIASNKQVMKETETYVRLLETLDREFRTIMEKSSLGSLEEVGVSFIRAEERNIAMNDYMSYLSQKAVTLGQHNAKLREMSELEERTLREVKERQTSKSLENTQQSNFFESCMSKSKISIDRMSTLSESLNPTFQQLLTALSSNPHFSLLQRPNTPSKICQSSFLEKLGLLEKYLDHYLELKLSTANRQRTAATTEKHTRARKQAPLTETSQNEEKSLMCLDDLREYAGQVIAKRLLEKSERYIANANVSWVKEMAMSK